MRQSDHVGCFRCCVFGVYQAGQDFHADLYPDTAGHTPAMTAEDWWKGENKQVNTSVLVMRNSMDFLLN